MKKVTTGRNPNRREATNRINDATSRRNPKRVRVKSPTKAPEMIFHAVSLRTGLSQSIFLKLLYPELTNRQVADYCGIDPTALSRDPAYKRLIASFRELGMPKGTKNKNGDLEAWETSPQ